MFIQGNIAGQSGFWTPGNNIGGSASSVMPLQNINVLHTAETANEYNQQLDNYLTKFGEIRTEYQQELGQYLKGNGSHEAYTYRQRGVDLAWKYEKADIEMGGRGSEKWTRQERTQILQEGRVEGTEGHHQQNVADHPSEQSNPDNIKFYRNRQEHLEQGHGGDFHNESDAPMKDKDQMLRDTNEKRLVKNEVIGMGIAAVIAFATAFSIKLIVAAAQDGITPEAFKDATIAGINGSVVGSTSFVIGRSIVNHITPAIAKALENLGFTVTENIRGACTMGITGVSVIVIVSIAQYIRLRRKGYCVKNALITVGKQAVISIGILVMTVLIQALFGNVVALVVGLALGVVLLSINIIKIIHNKELNNKIQHQIANLLMPIYD